MDKWSVIIGISVLLYLLKWYLRSAKYSKPTEIKGKIVIITGANTGIGKANAIDLAKRGGKIYIACRDKSRGETALREIKEESGSDNVYFMPLDLASQESIREFSKKFHEKEKQLHILINNAGLIAGSKEFTSDGFELTFGVNHLGPFLLTNLLIDLLKKSSPSRIVMVSSIGHRFGTIKKNDLMGETSFGKISAYGQSKLANILFANELSRKLKGTGVTANSCHPGSVETEIGRRFKWGIILKPLLRPWMKTPLEGAQTQIRLAVDPELENVTGKYFDNCKEAKTTDEGQDEKIAAWLFEKSAELVKLK